MHNLEDLAPVQTHDGETMNFLDALPDPDAGPQESLVHQEDRANEQQFQEQFHAFLARGRPARFLGNRRALQSLYACLCAGVSSRQELARELKVTPRVIKNRLRCLQRRAAAFSRLNPSERIQKGAKKVALQILHLQGLAEAA